MTFLKWFSFILVCLDTIGYIIDKTKSMKSIGNLTGFLVGIACRVFVLYGTATCWLLV